MSVFAEYNGAIKELNEIDKKLSENLTTEECQELCKQKSIWEEILFDAMCGLRDEHKREMMDE